MLEGIGNIFLIGPMGAGKSTIGKKLASTLNREFFDSDKEIEYRTGVDINWIFDVEGESGFRIREEKVIHDLTEKYGIVLSTGGGSVILDSVRKRLSSKGIVIYLSTSIETQLIRTQWDKNRPVLCNKKNNGDNSINVRVILEKLAAERNVLYEEIADMIFNTDTNNIYNIVQNIINDLSKKNICFLKNKI